ncbi:MAG: serine/threonine-protein kinase [Sandaracinaceae bacterium]
MTDPAGDRYRLVRQIGAGGMAQVVEAIATGDSGFERRVAIKWVLPEMADDESMRRMFLDEARIASHLHHANIVQVVDYGSMEGSEFLVCEFVDGVDAHRARKKRSGAVPETVALHIVSEIAHALDHAHGRCDASGRELGIVHRDVSPQNILLSWDGDIKLSDFGIAFALLREERTTTGMVKGKASYMAPEQARAEAVTGAVDVYALGVTLRVLLTGSPGVRYGMPYGDAPQELAPDIAALVGRCLAASPDARPTAREVAELASNLRAARTSVTGRSELRDWLTPLHEAPKRTRAIDQFAGAVVVETSPGSRVFELRRGDDPPTRVEGNARVTPPDRAPRSSPSRVRSWTIAAIVLAGVGTLGGMLTGWSVTNTSGDDPPGIASDGGPEDGGADAGVRLADGGPQVDGGSREVDGGAGQHETDAGEGNSDAGDNGTDDHLESTPPRAPPRPEPGPVRTATTGFIRVVGRRASGNPVEIDGRPRGYAIRQWSVPVGAHRVVVRDGSGEMVLVDVLVSVSEAHTALDPRIVRVE